MGTSHMHMIAASNMKNARRYTAPRRMVAEFPEKRMEMVLEEMQRGRCRVLKK